MRQDDKYHNNFGVLEDISAGRASKYSQKQHNHCEVVLPNPKDKCGNVQKMYNKQ